jgi:phosphoenolpyruvate carboxykinase (ATP)
VNILLNLQLLKHCTKVTSYLSNKEVFIRDSYVCADPNYKCSRTYGNTLGKFILLQYVLRPEQQELEKFTPEWTLLCVPSFLADLQLMVHVKAILPY